MLLNEDAVLIKGDREMKRLWLAGTVAAGLCAGRDYGYPVAQNAVQLADEILAELAKEKTK